MAESQQYNLIYAPEVKEHLKAIDKQHHAQIREAIEERLNFEPGRETRNRILAIGVKDRNELVIGKERVKL